MAARINQNSYIKPENIIIFVSLNSFQDLLSHIVFNVDQIDICESERRNCSNFTPASMITGQPLRLFLELWQRDIAILQNSKPN